MNRLSLAALVCVLSAGLVRQADAGEKEAKAVIDKAIKAMGGEEKLSKVKALSTKGRGTVVIDGGDLEFTYETTARGIAHYRSSFEGEADGNKFRGVVVLDGDKGWRKFNEDTKDLQGDELANEKRNAYIDLAPVLLVPLKGKEFKLDSEGEEKLDGKPASVVRVTGPDGKDFKILFDKETSLPGKVSGRVADWEGEEYDQETILEGYKEFEGIKVATKTRTKKNGARYVDTEDLEFKVLDAAPPDAFARPK